MTFKLKKRSVKCNYSFYWYDDGFACNHPSVGQSSPRTGLAAPDRIIGVCPQYVSFIHRKYHLPFTGYQCKGKPTTAESGSYDDLRSDRRKLHTDLPDRSERSHRKAVMYPGMERGTGWNHRESLLDHLPEVVFFCNLHRHGVAVCAGILPDLSRTVQTGFRMASRRRHHLYDRRCYLCTESADFQCET